ncbi:MAG: hypothetical protein AB7K24_15580 [Gemmataceae bacterium]
MTPAAIVFMTIFWSLVISMLIFCYTKMLRSGKRFEEHTLEDKP